MQRKENKRRQPSWSVASCWGTERGQSLPHRRPQPRRTAPFFCLIPCCLHKHMPFSHPHTHCRCCAHCEPLLVSGNRAGGDGALHVEALLSPPFTIWRNGEHVMKWGCLVCFAVCQEVFVQLWKCNFEHSPFRFPKESANSPLFIPTANICHSH